MPGAEPRALTAADVEALERCLASGGVAVFPADTVYGLACDPADRDAVRRLYALKRRPLGKPSAVMLFALALALDALPELGPRTVLALGRLFPGPVGVLLPNPQRRCRWACGENPTTLGLRIPRLPAPLAPLERLERALLQSSANEAGGPDPRSLEEVPAAVRAGADLVLDGGTLPGVASTLVDLRRYEATGRWEIARPGALPPADVAVALES